MGRDSQRQRWTGLFASLVWLSTCGPRCSHSFVNLQLSFSTALSTCSFRFPQLCQPATFCSHSFVSLQLSVPTALSTCSFLFLQLCQPAGFCSQSFVNLRLPVPTALSVCGPAVPTALSTCSFLFQQLCQPAAPLFLQLCQPAAHTVPTALSSWSSTLSFSLHSSVRYIV